MALGSTAHAAIRIPHTRIEKIVQDGSDDGISQMLMQNRHCAGLDFAAKAISNDQYGTRAPLGNEQRDLGEIVAVVGISHHNELLFCFLDSLTQSAAIATSIGVDHAPAL